MPRPHLVTDRVAALLVGAVVLVVYAATMARTIYTGDDGDFLTAMATGGICHPTGYPTFLWLGRAWLALTAFVPAEPAARINALTALCGAGAAAVFFRLALAATGHRIASAGAALLLAFTPTLWQQSLSTEVYAPGALLLAGALWLALRVCDAPEDPGPRRWLALLLGLSLTHNLAMALFLPGFVALALTRSSSWRRRPAEWLRLVGLFVLPLCAYASLPIAARADAAPVLWGDPSRLDRLVAHLSGTQYRTAMFSLPPALWLRHLVDHGARLGTELGPTLLLVPLGWRMLASRARPLLGLTLWIWVVNTLHASSYHIFDAFVYTIPGTLCLALWIGLGLARAASWLPQERRAALSAAALSLLLIPLSVHGPAVDKSGNTLEDDFSADILASCPPNAVVVTPGNVTMTLWYRKWVRGERPDVVVVTPEMFLGRLAMGDDWYYRHVKRQWPGIRDTYPNHRVDTATLASGRFLVDVLAHALRSGRPVVYVAEGSAETVSKGNLPPLRTILSGFVRVPWGIGERLYLPGAAPSALALLEENERLWPRLRTRRISARWAFADPLQVQIPLRCFDACKAIGMLAESQGHAGTAREAYEAASRLYADPQVRERLAGPALALRSGR